MTLTSLTWFDLSVVIAIASISLKAGRILQKLDNVIEDVKGLKEYGKRLTILETGFEELEKKLAAHDNNPEYDENKKTCKASGKW